MRPRRVARFVAPRVAYLDLDGTLTRDGSMFHGRRGLTLAGARAIHALHEAGVRIVPASGRTAVQLREVARLLGSRDFIAELGSVVVREGEAEVTYERARWEGTHAPQGRALLGRLTARLAVEPYEPWYSMREHTLLLKGRARMAEALCEVVHAAAPGMTAIDNGEVEPDVHTYHVLPADVSKEHAIRKDLAARGWGPEDAVAFGDSEGDRAMAKVVGRMYHVGGPDGENVTGVAARYAEGFEEAVRRCLGLSGAPRG